MINRMKMTVFWDLTLCSR